ncbi:MAG TPA: hypothetical protein VMM18_16405, partial [Gemmatimonadaceae bacterium]|nr:hypothetical protein [Gemmatimonadaceae bacterium]
MPETPGRARHVPAYLFRMPATELTADERRIAVETCRAVLAGDLGMIEAAHRLGEMPRVLASAGEGDPAVAILASLAFETAHLAAGESGGLFDEASLAERSAEKARLEMLVREDVIA